MPKTPTRFAAVLLAACIVADPPFAHALVNLPRQVRSINMAGTNYFQAQAVIEPTLWYSGELLAAKLSAREKQQAAARRYPISTTADYQFKGRRSVVLTAAHRQQMDIALARIRSDHAHDAGLLEALATTQIKLVEGFHLLAHYHFDRATMTGIVVQDLLARNHPVANLMTLYHEMLHAAMRRKYGLWISPAGEEVAVTYLELAYFFRLSYRQQLSYLFHVKQNPAIEGYSFMILVGKLRIADRRNRADILGLIADAIAIDKPVRAVHHAGELLKDLEKQGSGHGAKLGADDGWMPDLKAETSLHLASKAIDALVGEAGYFEAESLAHALKMDILQFAAAHLYLAGEPEKAGEYFKYMVYRGMSADVFLTRWQKAYPSARYPTIDDVHAVLGNIARTLKVITFTVNRPADGIQVPVDADTFPQIEIGEELHYLFDGESFFHVALGDDMALDAEIATAPNILKRIREFNPAAAALDLAMTVNGEDITHDRFRIKKLGEKWRLSLAARGRYLNSHWIAGVAVLVLLTAWSWLSGLWSAPVQAASPGILRPAGACRAA